MPPCISPKSTPYDPVKSEAAKELLAVISKDLGPLSKFTSWGPDAFHMPFLELFVGFWGVHREAIIVEGAHPRALKGIVRVHTENLYLCSFLGKEGSEMMHYSHWYNLCHFFFLLLYITELVAAAVSAISNCDFCANAHGLCAQAAGMQAAMKVIQQREPSLIADEHARKVTEWALNIYHPNKSIIRSPPMNTEEAAELIGSVFATIYINAVTHNFVSDRAIPPKAPEFVRKAYEKNGTFKACVDKLAVRLLKKEPARAGKMDKVYGGLPKRFDEESIRLPNDMIWVEGNDYIQRNMKFWYWAIENCTSIVQTSLRSLVEEYVLQRYKGESLDNSSPREWANEIIDQSPHGKFVTENQDRVWAELMLVVAVDPTKLNGCNVLQDFRRKYPGEIGEQKLKCGVMLAAFLRARRICSFLGRFLQE